MSNFPLPVAPAPGEAALEDGIIRWIVVLLPVVIIGHLLGGLALVAFLISTNFSVLGWVE